MSFDSIKVGDVVTRLLGGRLPMQMRVTQVDGDVIHCGSWMFDRVTGAEIDHDLDWGPAYGITGSFLVTSSDPEGATPHPVLGPSELLKRKRGRGA